MKIHMYWHQGESALGYIGKIIDSTRQYCDVQIFDRFDVDSIIPHEYLSAVLKIKGEHQRIMAISDLMSFFVPFHVNDDTWFFDVDFVWLKHPRDFPWIMDDLNYFRQSNNEIGANAVFYPKAMLPAWKDYIIPTLDALKPRFGENDLSTCEYPLRNLPFGKVFKQAALFPLSMSDIHKYVNGRNTLAATCAKVLNKQSYGVHMWHGQFYRYSQHVKFGQSRFMELFDAILTIRSHYADRQSKHHTG